MSPGGAQADAGRASPDSRGLALPALAGVAIGVGAWALYGSPKLNYDTAYALVWGDQLVRGQVPDYTGIGAPTPHPLQIGAAALASLFDADDTYRLVHAGAYLSFGLLLAAVLRLGQVLHSTAAGLIALAIIGTSGTVVELGVTAAKEIVFVLIIVMALILEAGRRRRGTPVLLLLAAAGLIRPEAWAIAGAYWLYVARPVGWRARAQMLGLVLLAPAIWLLSDLVVTGDAWHSFDHTHQGTEHLGRPTGAQRVPSQTLEGLRSLVGLAGLAGAAVGALLLVRRRARHWLPVGGVALVVLVVFAVEGAARMPLSARLLMPAAVGLALLCGVAVVELLRRGRRARSVAWTAAGAGLVVALVMALPGRVDDGRERRHGLRVQAEAFTELHKLARTGPTASALRACPFLGVYVFGPVGASEVPYLLYNLQRDPDSVSLLGDELPARAAVVLPRPSGPAAAQLVPAGGVPQHAEALDAGFRSAGQGSSWVVLSRGC